MRSKRKERKSVESQEVQQQERKRENGEKERQQERKREKVRRVAGSAPAGNRGCISVPKLMPECSSRKALP